MEYTKRPLTVEAIQFNNINREEVEAFVGRKLKQEIESETAYIAGVAPPISSLTIPTKEGDMKAFPGDYIIKEPFPTGDRDFYPCKESIFTQTYSPMKLMVKETFKDRLLAERTELNEKRSKLDAFIGSGAFTKIDPVQKTLLHIQLQSMATYAECLTQRIAWLDTTECESIAGSNGLTVEPDADLDQVVVQGEINMGPPL